MSHSNETPYDRVAGTYDDHYSTPLDKTEDRIIQRLLKRYPPRQQILDLGCGTGAALRMYAAVHGMEFEYCGVDCSAKMLDAFNVEGDMADERIKYNGVMTRDDRSYFGWTIDKQAADTWVRRFQCTIRLHRCAMPDLPRDFIDVRFSPTLILALWSLNYLTREDLGMLFRELVRECSSGAKFIATWYTSRYRDDARYVCIGDDDATRFVPDVDRLHFLYANNGWRIKRMTPMTGPWARRFNGARWAREIDALFVKHFDAYNFVIVEAERV